MSNTYLVARGSAYEGVKLYATYSLERVLAGPHGRSCRVSPIFRVVPSSERALPVRPNLFVGLLCPLKAFEFIGKQPLELKQQIWFSLGLASVLIFSDHKENIEAFCKESEVDLAGWEIWHVGEENEISVVGSKIRSAQVPTSHLAHFPNLSKDAERLLEEIELNLHEAMRCAAIFMPELVPRLQSIVKSANEIAEEVNYFEDPATRPKPGGWTQQQASRTGTYDPNQRLNQG